MQKPCAMSHPNAARRFRTVSVILCLKKATGQDFDMTCLAGRPRSVPVGRPGAGSETGDHLMDSMKPGHTRSLGGPRYVIGLLRTGLTIRSVA